MQKLEVLNRLDSDVSFEFERLLKEAMPAQLRLHQLVKTFQGEASTLSYHEIEKRLLALYELRYHERTSAVVSRKFGIRPYPWLMGQLLLNFSNAVVTETKKYRAATSLNHLLISTLELPGAMVSTALLHDVVHRLTKPRVDQKNTGLHFDDFIDRWQHVCFLRFGDRYDSAFAELLQLLPLIQSATCETQTSSLVLTTHELNPLEVSQTDLDWMKAILETLTEGRTPPLHPLSRGPKNPNLVRIETLVRTLRLIPENKQAAIKAAVSRTCSTLILAYGQSSSDESTAA